MIKNLDRSIQGMVMWNSQEKIKTAMPREQNYAAWLVKNSKTVFSKLTQKISFQYQASRRASKQALGLEPFFLRILDTFHIFKLLF